MLLNINNSSFNVKVVVSEKEVQRGIMVKKFNEKFKAWLVIHVANKRSFYDAEERCEKTKLKRQIFKLES